MRRLWTLFVAHSRFNDPADSADIEVRNVIERFHTALDRHDVAAISNLVSPRRGGPRTAIAMMDGRINVLAKDGKQVGYLVRSAYVLQKTRLVWNVVVLDWSLTSLALGTSTSLTLRYKLKFASELFFIESGFGETENVLWQINVAW